MIGRIGRIGPIKCLQPARYARASVAGGPSFDSDSDSNSEFDPDSDFSCPEPCLPAVLSTVASAKVEASREGGNPEP